MQPEGHFRLTVRQGLTPGKVFELARDEITIGRDLKADVVLNDPEISRNHCRLTAQAGGYQVEDLESTNGTFVNNQKVTGGPRMLQPGDLVGLGENLVLEYGVSDAAAATIVMQPGAHIPVMQAPPPPPPPVEPYAPPPAALPDMGAGMPPMGEPGAPPEPAWMAAPPPPPAAPVITTQRSNRNLIIGIVVAVILLCCCCTIVALAGYYYFNIYSVRSSTGWLPLLSLLTL